MHLVLRSTLVLAALLTVPVRGELQSEYRQADTKYYLRSELYKADPGACVVTPDQATNIGGSYLISTSPHAPQVIYLQETHNWLEPITPPNMPASLNCPSGAMQVREPQGSVQVALPSAPADFRDVKSGMSLPNGAVLRAGDGSSVAVLFGGVDSVRLAPNTRAAVQMTVTSGLRDVEVDIRGGMVFSKVGQRVGEQEAYAVHTPFGVASAHGTDYVTVALPHRVDVWVAQGTVALDSPDGVKQVTVSTGNEPLKIMRNPPAPDDATANAESAESLTALLNFIPMANQKLKALAARSHGGERLTATEKEYVGRIRQVTSLIKLATGNAPIAPAPMPEPVKPVVLAAPPAPAKPAVEAWTEKNYPKAKPLIPAPASGKPAVAAMPSATHLAKPKSAATPAQTAAASAKSKKIAKASAKPRHPAAVATDVSSALAPPPDSPYPRAKPVDAADLIAPPAVMNTPPPARAPSAPNAAAAGSADPNSLDAQLNPFHTVGGTAPATINPRPAADATQSGLTSPMGGVTGKATDTTGP